MHIKNGSLRYKLGVLCIILSFVSPAFALVIPFLGFSTETIVTLSTIFLIGLPEVFLILGAVLAGKKIANILIEKVKAWLFFRKNKK
jgi:hypothetical protein